MDKAIWVVAAATLLGPVLAVQAQKWLERLRERRNRKQWLFHTLMATRASRLSNDHVTALNSIDLVFYGWRLFGKNYRSKTEQAVLDAWHEYHDHLNTKADDASLPIWFAKGDELFVNLLFAIATDVDLRFDRVQLKKGAYSPMAHGELESDNLLIRKLAVKVLSGENPIRMNVINSPNETPKVRNL